MKIWVPIKRVPDTTARIRPDRSGKSIEAADLKFVINPYDEYALEESLVLRDKIPGSEVIAISIGTADAGPVLRQALAVGADRAVLLLADLPIGLEIDNAQAGAALAGYLKTQPVDLIFQGRIAVDLQSGVVGSWLARQLGMPRITEVIKVEWTGEGFRAHHLVRGQVEVVEAAPPLVLTAQKGLNEPRYPALKGILAAKKKPIETVPAQLPEAALELIEIEPPPARQPVKILGHGPEAVPELIRLLRTEAKVL